MRTLPALLLLALLPPLAGRAAPQAAGADAAGGGVTIYRCTDAGGRLSLRDSPCLPGERQEVRSMLRPKDAPPRPVATLPPPRDDMPMAAPSPQVVFLQPPRPLYECVTPDNTRYLSDSPEGNPRLVPMWVTDGPAIQAYREYQPPQLQVRVDDGRVSGGYTSGGWRDRIVTGWAGQHWIRDACHPLPQTEVCARLRDRRDEIRRRFAIAQPSERAALGREERSINARLTQDCP